MSAVATFSDAPPVIAWFREDFRLADNPALHEAATNGAPVIPLYILDDRMPGDASPGSASRWWLERSLGALAATLRRLGTDLVLRRGDPATVLNDIVSASGARKVLWNRVYEPYSVSQDTAIRKALSVRGVETASFKASLLFEPWDIRTGSGGPYRVFTPFWKACRARAAGGLGIASPLPPPRALRRPEELPESDALSDWALYQGTPDWAAGFPTLWLPGEGGARIRLDGFLEGGAHGYAAARDRPGIAGTSLLSPHLRFGEIGPRQVWHALAARRDRHPAIPDRAVDAFLAEIGWREFCRHLLFHWHDLPRENFRREFDAFPWREDPRGLRAWQRGMTGYPIVDAGMRQLWRTGWMHNRARMIAASFLVKDLMVDWRAGAAWFMDTLVDADLASNAANWQWVAGSGTDAAPYFRVFNPVLQGRKLDPAGDYVRRWVPELAALPDRHIHDPWNAPAAVLAGSGIAPGVDYPLPIVDHDTARRRALAAWRALPR